MRKELFLYDHMIMMMMTMMMIRERGGGESLLDKSGSDSWNQLPSNWLYTQTLLELSLEDGSNYISNDNQIYKKKLFELS